MAASRRTNQRLTLLMLVLASVTALTLDYRGTVSHGITHVRNGIHDALSPIQRGISFVLNPVGDVFAGVLHYGSLETQNEQLRTELGNVRRELSADKYAQSQTESVLALAKLPYVNGIPWIPAIVIGEATSNFQETIEIDKGTSQGAGPAMPVVGESGLVGVISAASSQSATVVLATDASSTIAVRIGTGGGLYRAQGAGRGRAQPVLRRWGDHCEGRPTRLHERPRWRRDPGRDSRRRSLIGADLGDAGGGVDLGHSDRRLRQLAVRRRPRVARAGVNDEPRTVRGAA